MPPSSDVIATATNPRQIGLTDGDLDLTEMGLQTLCYPLQYFRSHRDMQSAPPSLLGQISLSLITQIGPAEIEQSVLPRLQSHLGETEIPIGETDLPRVCGSGYDI